MSTAKTKRYRALIEALGMTQTGAARFLAIGDRTSRRWVKGDIEVPLAVMMLLEIMVERGIEPKAARKLAHASHRGDDADYSDRRFNEAD